MDRRGSKAAVDGTSSTVLSPRRRCTVAAGTRNQELETWTSRRKPRAARFLGTVGAAGVAGAALAGGAVARRARPTRHRYPIAPSPRDTSPSSWTARGSASSATPRAVTRSERWYGRSAAPPTFRRSTSATSGTRSSRSRSGRADCRSPRTTGSRRSSTAIPPAGAARSSPWTSTTRSRRSGSSPTPLISEVSFPTLDGSSKDAAFLTVKLVPEQTVDRPASGKLPAPGEAEAVAVLELPARAQRPATAEGEQDRCVHDQADGRRRRHRRGAGPRDGAGQAASSRISTSRCREADAEPWFDWFDDFVLRGNNGDEAETVGPARLSRRPTSRRCSRALEFSNLGIFKISTDKPEASERRRVKRFKAELVLRVGERYDREGGRLAVDIALTST